MQNWQFLPERTSNGRNSTSNLFGVGASYLIWVFFNPLLYGVQSSICCRLIRIAWGKKNGVNTGCFQHTDAKVENKQTKRTDKLSPPQVTVRLRDQWKAFSSQVNETKCLDQLLQTCCQMYEDVKTQTYYKLHIRISNNTLTHYHLKQK